MEARAVMKRFGLPVLVVLVVVLGAGTGYVVGRGQDGDDETGVSNAELRELSAQICGHQYVDNGGWEDEDYDGHGWLIDDPEHVLSYDDAVARSVENCRRDGIAHVDDGDVDRIHDYLDPRTCFEGVPDYGPPPSGAPWCAELAD
jgi:hypothetical protein